MSKYTGPLGVKTTFGKPRDNGLFHHFESKAQGARATASLSAIIKPISLLTDPILVLIPPHTIVVVACLPVAEPNVSLAQMYLVP